MTGWIADVEPYEPIEDTWGNLIRDRTITVLADYAAMIATISTPHTGMVCYTVADKTYWYYETRWKYLSTDWVAFAPIVKLGQATVTVTHSFAYRIERGQCNVVGAFKYQSGSASGDGVVRFQLPVSPYYPLVGAVYVVPVGTGLLFPTNGSVYTFTPTLEGAADIVFRSGNFPSAPPAMSYNSPGLIAVGDEYHLNLSYRIAAAASLLDAEGKPAPEPEPRSNDDTDRAQDPAAA